MKKQYLTYAGIVSALVLVSMFIIIVLNAFPYQLLSPTVTIDPITNMNVDENNRMILTGTTSLPVSSMISITISASPGSLSPGTPAGKTTVKGMAEIFPAEGRSNRWKAAVDISPLQPADYIVSMATSTWTENYTQLVESNTTTTQQFTLADENTGPGSIRKKPTVIKPFIRVNSIEKTQPAKNLVISGITSLAPGTPLSWRIQQVTNGIQNSIPEFQGGTVVIPGTEGINRWSIGPLQADMKTARYQLTITGNPTGTTLSAGNISAGSEFDLLSFPTTITNATGPAPVTPEFITIDSLPDIRTNGVYIITGTTSLPPGGDLLVEITPRSFMTEYNFSFDSRDNSQKDASSSATGTFSGAIGMVRVVNGSHGDNLWAFDLETYQITPGMYEVNASNSRFDEDVRDRVPGNLSSSRIFTIAD
jgi:hypothetical protein